MLGEIESNFINSNRGEFPKAHKEVYQKAVNLMTSDQMRAFEVAQEPDQIKQMYGVGGGGAGMGMGANRFGEGCLLARRLVESGVPFVEVDMGGWDLHNDVFNTLRDQRLPQTRYGHECSGCRPQDAWSTRHTQPSSGWVSSVVLHGSTKTSVVTTGQPVWSAVVGGGGLKGGQAIGATDKDGIGIEGQSYVPGNIWASVAHALGIPLDTVHTSKRGRPMKIANGQPPIAELIG